MQKFEFLKAFISPFKRPKLHWYAGKIAIGTPIFFPRKLNEKTRQFEPKKIGFDFVGLGYKTKWDATDYRYEWAPVWSFVFFKWQIALQFVPDEVYHYWIAWLYYNNDTKGTRQERIQQCKEKFSMDATIYRPGQEPEKVNYYNIILKDKYK